MGSSCTGSLKIRFVIDFAKKRQHIAFDRVLKKPVWLEQSCFSSENDMWIIVNISNEVRIYFQSGVLG